MSAVARRSDFIEEHRNTPVGMAFFDSLESVRAEIGLIGFWSVIERAWQILNLDGVLFMDGRPILYLKEYQRPISSPERIRLQRLFWNQGVANILVLADPTSVFIYSGLAKPLHDSSDDEAIEAVLVDTMTKAAYALQVQTFYHGLATGHYYEKKKNCFDPDQSVDKWLLDNLRALRDELIKDDEGGKLNIKDAHAFIGRVLFLCYLLDRGIITVGVPEKKNTGTMLLASQLSSRTFDERLKYLYNIFDNLKDRFNGNMFDQDLAVERSLIQRVHLEKLVSFLSGDSVKSGQRTLGFWPYDFKMIPVETISAIYQDFLKAENQELQKKRGAFYTPRFLAELVVDRAIRDEPGAFDWSYLDPACGSGIFLVILFNRLANHWIHNQKRRVNYLAKAEALQKILAKQIYGIDIEVTACRITCFSLYLAYLDFFDPPDINQYIEITGKSLPKLLDYGDEPNQPKAEIPIIHKGDFLDSSRTTNRQFDCIIGNPPWQGRGKKQLAQKFLNKGPDSLRSGGVGCLLLPTKILQNQTDAFQAEWLKRVSLESVLQLADYRFLLFQNSLCPAIIARFKKTVPDQNNYAVEFAAPKFNRDGLRQGVITLNPSARKWIPLSEILAATETKTTPIVWKRHLWGTPRDQKLLDLFLSLPPLGDLAGAPKENKRWIKGQGFQPNTSGKSKDPKSPWWEKSDLYIGATASCWGSKILQLNRWDCEAIGDRFPSLHRPRDRRIYQGPMVLVSKGFGKVAYSDFNVLFQDSLRSISGPREDTNLLMFLTAYLRSNLARYFLFHTAANWGTERDQIHLGELLRVPFPLPGSQCVSSDAQEIVETVSHKFGQLKKKLQNVLDHLITEAKSSSLFNNDEEAFEMVAEKWNQERRNQVDAMQKEFEPLIFRYFGLTAQEITLVEDTINVFEPSSTPSTWRSSQTVTLDPMENTKVEPYATEGFAAYADTLTMTLNNWAEKEGSDYRVRAEGGVDTETGLAMVTVLLSSERAVFQNKSFSGSLSKVIEDLFKHATRIEERLNYQRDIFLFQGDKIHIVRPNILFNWTRTAALNDAVKIYGEITMSQRE